MAKAKRLLALPLTPEEHQRYIEIKFYMLVHSLFHKGKSPVIIFNILDELTELFECNKLIVRGIIQTIISADRKFKPTQKELYVLMHRTGYPVRKTIRQTSLSNPTYYRRLKKYLAEPDPIISKYTKIQTQQMEQFLDQLETILNAITIDF